MPLFCNIVGLGMMLCCMMLAGCRGAGRGSENAAGAGSVTHVVMFWLNDPGNGRDRDQLIAACRALDEIPGVTDLRVGGVLPSTRPVVDSSYDVGLVVTFKNPQAMQDYGPHPIHQKLVRGMGPKIRKFVVYDFVNE